MNDITQRAGTEAEIIAGTLIRAISPKVSQTVLANGYAIGGGAGGASASIVLLGGG